MGETNEGESKRDHVYPNYRLIKPEILRRIAEVMTAGAEKYGVGNWEAMTMSQNMGNLDHAMVHLLQFNAGDRTEDHLAHLVCNIMIYMWHEERYNVLAGTLSLGLKPYTPENEVPGRNHG